MAPDGHVVAGVTIGVHGAAETANLGGGLLRSAGQYGMVVGKFTADGDHIWSRQFSSTDWSSFADLTVNDEGAIFLTGTFEGEISFGGATPLSADARDIFVTKLGPDGSHIWSTNLGDEHHQFAGRVALSSSGQPVVLGSFDEELNLGAGLMESMGQSDVFVAQLDANGALVWTAPLGTAGDDLPSGLEVDPTNGSLAVVVSASFDNDPYAPLADLLLARLSSNGDIEWTREFAAEGAQYARTFVLDSAGNFILGGVFDTPFDLGGGELVPRGWNPDYEPRYLDGFLAKFAPSGEHIWSIHFGGSFHDGVSGLAIDEDGDLLVSGDFHYGFEIGGDVAPLEASDRRVRGFIARFSAQGGPLGLIPIGGAARTRLAGPPDEDGRLLISGRFFDELTLPPGTLRSSHWNDAFIARIEAP